MITVTNATKKQIIWISQNSLEYADMRSSSGIDIVFCPTEDAKLEELFTLNS